MKTLRAHGFNQRPRFEQVVGYLERNEPLPLDQPDRKATSFVTSHFYTWTILYSPARPQPPAPAAHTSAAGNSPWQATVRGRPPLRTVCAARQTALRPGLAAAQTFRSQLPQDAAEYVRLNAGQAIEDGGRGRGGGRGRRRSLRVPGRPGRRLAGAAGVGTAATAGLAVGIAGGAAYGLARGTGWVLENTLFQPQQGSKGAAVQDVRSANGMNDATQPQHFTLRTGGSTSGSPASSRASSQSSVSRRSPTTRRAPSPGLNPVALPQSQPSSRAVTPELASAKL